jgi:ubiquinone/menaquinone biosynthesis C-methylase UbiE
MLRRAVDGGRRRRPLGDNPNVSSATEVRHPVFARMYARMANTFEAKGGAEHRREFLASATGQVIEVGAGTGLNFRHYPDTVTEVVAVEPEAYLRARAEEAARRAPVSVRVVAGTADALPAEDESFDVAVASLVLCSVPDQASALAEIKRVLRSGGELRFYEHIRSHDPRLARIQRRADRIWPRVGGGCHTARVTDEAIQRTGFNIETKRDFIFRPTLLTYFVSPHVIGLARRP